MENRKDEIIRYLAYDGRVNVVCADTTKLVEEARKTHDLSPVASIAFGKTLTMTVMMAQEMKSEKDKLTIQVRGNGPIGQIITTATNQPIVKGYVQNPLVDMPLDEFGKLDASGAVGHEGLIYIIKDIGLKEPYIGVAPIVTGEIADDFANYYLKSQQQPAAIALGVLLNKDGIKSSGGYIITPMPDATQEDIARLEESVFKAGAISKMLEKNLSLDEIAKLITGEENIKRVEDQINPQFKCECSKEQFLKGLITLGKEEITKILEEDEKIETQCRFCNKKYEFIEDDFKGIF